MKPHLSRAAFLFLLALVFTVGLSFVTVELPYLIDRLLQDAVTTPNLDSHASEVSRLKTELFMAHYHLRAIGYVCFSVMILLIIAGFATRNTGLATAGALAFMLPVFAQFAGVMFFLAGLGLLNVLWLPVLDISFEVARLGLVVRAPFDLVMWLLRQVGVNGYWPIVYLCVGGGLLLFFLGTLAWLSARARKEGVADFWVYRISRHPQYLGWIIWSYGVYLLLLRGLYPRRSWGIDASLPWLLSTLVIIGVAMMEELDMRKRYGEAYDTYRRSAPFLFPVPGFVESLFALPFRVLFRKKVPDRKREVAVVLTLCAVLLMLASSLFYGGGLVRTMALLAPARQAATMEELAVRIREEPNNRRKHFTSLALARFGDPAVDHFVSLLRDEQEEVRTLAAERLAELPAQRALPALAEALTDAAPGVRWRALQALAAIGSGEAVESMVRLLDDPEETVRVQAMRSLAELGAGEMREAAEELSRSGTMWTRVAGVEALGTLGSDLALPTLVERLADEEPAVRRDAVIALLRIGSTRARPALEGATRDEDWEVRVYAAEALKRLPEPGARAE